jgi:hypothetical protein
MIPRDTDAEAARVQMECWARLGPARRVALAIEMSEETREIALAGIRDREPGLDDWGARLQLARALFGVALADAAWPQRSATNV